MESKKAQILLVDDEVINLHILSDLLGDSYRLLVATSSEKALEIIQKELDTIDLILLDVMMPGMDGYELCKILKAKQKTAKIPILFVTSKESEEDELYGLSLGAIDYITKPYRPNVIKQKIHNHIQLLYGKKNAQDLVLDLANSQVQKGDEMFDLSKKERDLLALFVNYPKRVLSKEEIEYSLWNGESRSESSVKTLIRKVRLKIGEECIETVKNVGYRFVTDAKVIQK